jgi:hypothetical protein
VTKFVAKIVMILVPLCCVPLKSGLDIQQNCLSSLLIMMSMDETNTFFLMLNNFFQFPSLRNSKPLLVVSLSGGNQSNIFLDKLPRLIETKQINEKLQNRPIFISEIDFLNVFLNVD